MYITSGSISKVRYRVVVVLAVVVVLIFSCLVAAAKLLSKISSILGNLAVVKRLATLDSVDETIGISTAASVLSVFSSLFPGTVDCSVFNSFPVLCLVISCNFICNY